MCIKRILIPKELFISVGKNMSTRFGLNIVRHLVSILFVAIALAGCGGGSSDNANAMSSTQNPAAETPAAETTAQAPAAQEPAADAPPVPVPDAGSRLHLVFQSLNKGMTKAQVIAFVGIQPTAVSGVGLFWLGSDGGMMVYFSGDIIAVAEWGYLQPTNLPNEMRYF